MGDAAQVKWWEVGLDEMVEIDLTEEERSLLSEGLLQSGGPTRLTDDLARVMGFADRAALHAESSVIREGLCEGRSMTKRDWQRAIVVTEIVWASNFYGAAGDWAVVTGGWDDQRTLRVLRQIQGKCAGLRAPWRAHDAWTA